MGVANDPTVLRTRRLLKLSGQMGTLFTACLHGKHPLSLLFSLVGFFFSPRPPATWGLCYIRALQAYLLDWRLVKGCG